MTQSTANKLTTLIISWIIISASAAFAGIKTVEVETRGQGASLQAALNNALLEAIGQVKGKTLTARSELSNLEVSTAVGEQTGYFASDKYKNQVRTATSGAVAGYEILDQVEDAIDGGWSVTLRVKVSDYQSKATARKRIAILPLYVTAQKFVVAGGTVSASTVTRQLNQQLVNHLVQSRKFAILDRDYVTKTMSELNLSRSSQTPVEELARLGEKLVADYVLVGTVENFHARLEQRAMKLKRGQFVSAKGKVHINYRLIETATQQIVVSDSQKNTVTGKQLKDDDDSDLTRNSIIDGILEQVAGDISDNILSQIYPVLVTSVQGNIVTLGQGGKGLKPGEQYNVYQYGEQIYDPYTKEYLGRAEIYCCKVQITRVQAKQSYATIVSHKLDIGAQFQPGTFVLREQVTNDSASRASKRVESRREKNRNNDDW